MEEASEIVLDPFKRRVTQALANTELQCNRLDVKGG